MDLIDNIDPRARVTSGEGSGRLDLGIRQGPVEHQQQQSLPNEYGRLLVQLLVVDTEYVFITWEIPPAELAAQQALIPPAEFDARRLLVRLHDAAAPQTVGASQELYGDRGRWFMHHNLAGKRITASLGFACGDHFYTVCTTGPVTLPRDFFIEPASFTELNVTYGVGAGGELTLEDVRPRVHASWPEVGLREAFQPPPATGSTDTAPGTPESRRLVSAGTPWSGLPSSLTGLVPSSLTNIHQPPSKPDPGESA